jgi:hypothetical protein
MGRSFIAENNYALPPRPNFAVASQPGMARIDIDPDGNGCKKVWTNTSVRTPSAVAKGDTANGLIYTYENLSDDTGADPWYFPTPEDYGARLAARGFRTESITLFPRPTPLPGDVVGWLETFAQTFTAPLPAAERPAYLAEVRDALRPALCDAAGAWTADYVRLRFRAVKPA